MSPCWHNVFVLSRFTASWYNVNLIIFLLFYLWPHPVGWPVHEYVRESLISKRSGPSGDYWNCGCCDGVVAEKVLFELVPYECTSLFLLLCYLAFEKSEVAGFKLSLVKTVGAKRRRISEHTTSSSQVNYTNCRCYKKDFRLTFHAVLFLKWWKIPILSSASKLV